MTSSFTKPEHSWATSTPAWGVPETPPIAPEPEPTTINGLVELLHRQRGLLQDVGTGVVLFKDNSDAETEYRDRAAKIRPELRRRGISDPFPWRTLSDWWGHCRNEWSTYQERRDGLSKLLYPVTEALEQGGETHELHDGPASSAAAWTDIEGRIAGLKDEYVKARELDDYQDVARRSREILIDAVNLVWDPSMCPADQDRPQLGNAIARFDQIVGARLSGSSHEQLRGWFKKTWDLANRTTHSGTAARMSAFASGQATLALARTLHLLGEEVRPENPVLSDPPF